MMSTENGSGSGDGDQPAIVDLLGGGADDGGVSDVSVSRDSAGLPATNSETTHTGNGSNSTNAAAELEGSSAPETPSEKLSRGFKGIGGALGGIGAGIGRGFRGAVNARDEYTPSATKAAEEAEAAAAAESDKRLDKEAAEQVLKRMPSGTMNPAMEARATSFHRQNSTSGNPLGALTTSLASLTTSIGDGLTTTTEAIGSTVTQTVAGVGTSVSRGLTRQYTMPDRTVASQVLMYRQLLHTECKPGLRLSREYQGTPAQKAVMHMPWWEQGVEKTRRMVISYDNLIVRLWLSGGIMPYVEGGYAHKVEAAVVPQSQAAASAASISTDSKTANEANGSASATTNTEQGTSHVDTLIDAKGLPPIPHLYWVDRLGFQQTDPVTDFRSGGVLSLAMLVHVVEACPHVHARFLPDGPAHMLPFGITCINITDMLAKFLMFSKSVDRIDALLSQKPFWRMFGDPNSLLVCQELSMDMLADVVVEMVRERRIPGGRHESSDSLHGEKEGKVTVFDFAEILDRTEKRVRDDLLGAGPKSVPELRAVHAKLKVRYERAIAKKEREAEKKYGKTSDAVLMNKPVAAGAASLLGKISGGDLGNNAAEKDKPTQTVTAINEVVFGDSYDEADSSTVPSPAAAEAGTVQVTPSHSTVAVTATPPLESPSAAAQEQSIAADTLAPAPTTTSPLAAPPDLLGGALPAPTEEETKLSSDAGQGDAEFSIGEDDLNEEGILDFLDDNLAV